MGNYFLVSKTLGTSFNNYKGNALRITKQIPYTVDEVIIGIKNNTGRLNKLTTFRDSDGNPIERCYETFGKPFRNLVYSKSENIIGDDEFVKTTTIKEYKMPRKKASLFREKSLKCNDQDVIKKMFWRFLSLRNNHFSINTKTGEKILSTSEIEFQPELDAEIHSFTEYPHIVNRKKQGKEKTLVFGVNQITKNVIKGTEKAEGTVIPVEDSFIAYRAFDIESAKIKLAQKAIKDRKVDNLRINIYPEYIPKDKDEECMIAIFKNWNGDMCFNKFQPFISKAQIYGIASHEAEHAWQYSLDARLCEGGTPWCDMIYFLFGPIKSKKQIKEAMAYKKSIDNYVDYNGKNKEEYMKNYIEIKAHKAGDKAEEKYDAEGSFIRKEFPHIPRELL